MAHPDPVRSSIFRLALLATAVVALAAALVVRWLGASADATLTATVEEAVEADLVSLKAAFSTGGIDALTLAVAQKIRWGSGGLYLLVDADGRTRTGNVAAWPEELQGARAAGTFAYRGNAESQPSPARYAAGVAIGIDGGPRLLVGRDIEHHRQLLATLRQRSALGLGAIVLIGLVGGYLVSRHILGRIDALSSASHQMMTGDLSARLPLAGTDDELDRLAAQLNAMLQRIEQLMAGLREVSDNIAHDLKTPLNRLRNAAEAVLADPQGAPAWRDGLERTIEQADELIKTFNALLLIARLEAGAVSESFEHVDLIELCRGVTELYEPHAELHGLEIRCSAEGPLDIHANRHLVGQALANVIDNAIKYGTPPASGEAASPAILDVRISRRADTAEIVVADSGPGIPASERARALQRFTRLDASRSRPGTGLGLSLVAAVVRIHGGTLLLEDNSPGLKVVLRLPLATAGAAVAQGVEPRQAAAIGASP